MTKVKKMLTVTVLLTAAFVFYFSVKKMPVKVTVFEVKTIRADRTVSCSGRVDGRNVTDVEYAFPAVFECVNFRPGESVKKGDILAVVNRKKTAEMIDSLIKSYSSIISFSLPIENACTLLPENIISPKTGIITGCAINGNKFLNPGNPIFSISDSDDPIVRLSVGEKQASVIKEGQYAVVSGQGFSGKHSGKIIEIAGDARENYSLTESTAVIDVFVSLSDGGNYLKPGFSATAKILTGVNKNAIVIPYNLINQDENNNEYVFVAKDSIARKRLIKTGTEYENGTEVVSGLEKGELVIQNTENIYDGTRIKVVQNI